MECTLGYEGTRLGLREHIINLAGLHIISIYVYIWRSGSIYNPIFPDAKLGVKSSPNLDEFLPVLPMAGERR